MLHPIGFDSFGLPAENAAIREGGHPREITEQNIATITQSMRRMGWAFDWSRLISAHEPTYYVWDQWLFLKLLRGRASRTARARRSSGARRTRSCSRTSRCTTAAASTAAPR